ncbi:TetR/AcrR family transcriptional regulator [Parafrankia sp. EUN1f]|uniref:TetR/AcrR family transcriptional regulator n=1 Tax=Parafrankia sp. EUN1f TaxID=102897 RepID=UPI0001C46290|nr:TetR/AcrR family transcriptional regulator [Parafrankia sp. EUN1f]EFC83598.1 putative transcriptional regulator, TetR family [Parafrankia sp. EUN1f]
MSVPATPAENGGQARARRRYNSPVRRERAIQTRERIVTAGSELVHGFPVWDWSDLTFRAVAERAGVGERTVYRHFPTEVDLHGAVMRRLQEEAGVTYDNLGLDRLTEITARSFATLSSYAVARWDRTEPHQPALVAEDQRRRDALLAAVAPHSVGWSDDERAAAAGMLDVLWNVPTYERLVRTWNLTPSTATEAVSWVLDLVVEAIRAGHRPGTGRPEADQHQQAAPPPADPAQPGPEQTAPEQTEPGQAGSGQAGSGQAGVELGQGGQGAERE